MEGRGRWMKIRRISGRVVEESTVFVSPNSRERRGRKKGTTSARKQDENERDAVKRLSRLINCNFAHGDLLLTPKYDEEGMARLMDWAKAHQEEGHSLEDALVDAAEREGKNYIRRMERELEKAGVELRYILITSDMDGETGELVRPHHHIIMPRVAFEVAAKKWGLGTVDYQILRDQDDYTPLAEYLLRQVRRRKPDARKWTSSRNLDKPVVSQTWMDKPGRELAVEKGAKLMHRAEWEPGRPQYIRFVRKCGEAGSRPTAKHADKKQVGESPTAFLRSVEQLGVAEASEHDKRKCGEAGKRRGKISDTARRAGGRAGAGVTDIASAEDRHTGERKTQRGGGHGG